MFDWWPFIRKSTHDFTPLYDALKRNRRTPSGLADCVKILTQIVEAQQKQIDALHGIALIDHERAKRSLVPL